MKNNEYCSLPLSPSPSLSQLFSPFSLIKCSSSFLIQQKKSAKSKYKFQYLSPLSDHSLPSYLPTYIPEKYLAFHIISYSPCIAVHRGARTYNIKIQKSAISRLKCNNKYSQLIIVVFGHQGKISTLRYVNRILPYLTLLPDTTYVQKMLV